MAQTTTKTAVDRTAELSEEVLTSVEAGQRAAIEAVRAFVDTVDAVIPAIGDRPSRRENVIDAALDMADKLVTTQYDFLRSVVHSVDRSLGRESEESTESKESKDSTASKGSKERKESKATTKQ